MRKKMMIGFISIMLLTILSGCQKVSLGPEESLQEIQSIEAQFDENLKPSIAFARNTLRDPGIPAHYGFFSPNPPTTIRSVGKNP